MDPVEPNPTQTRRVFFDHQSDQPIHKIYLASPRIEDILPIMSNNSIVCYTAAITQVISPYTNLTHICLEVVASNFRETHYAEEMSADQEVIGLQIIQLCLSLFAVCKRSLDIYIIGVTELTLNNLRTGRSNTVPREVIAQTRQTLLTCGHKVTLVNYSDKYLIEGCAVARNRLIREISFWQGRQ